MEEAAHDSAYGMVFKFIPFDDAISIYDLVAA